MSHMPAQTGSSLDATERRQFPRHQVKSLAYLDIGQDNGGIVLNISESGLAVHAVSVLPPEPILGLRLQLPKSSKRLETKAKVAWTSGTKKEAGVEFVDLPDDARLEIKEWLLSENVLETSYVSQEPPAEPVPPRRARRTDKWTSLVAELTSAPVPAPSEHVSSVEQNEQAGPVAEAKNETNAPPGPLTIARSAAPESAPASPGADAGASPSVTHEEFAEGTRERNFGIVEALTNEASEASPEFGAQAESETASGFAAVESHPPGDFSYRKSAGELSLPSDTLLNTPSHPIAIVPDRTEKSRAASGSRNARESAATAPPADDFLRKARALFGPKRMLTSEPEPADSFAAGPPIAEPAPPENSAQIAGDAQASPALVSPMAAEPAPLPASPFGSAREQAPIEAVRPTADEPRISERTVRMAPRPTRTPARRGDFQGTMGVLAICLVVAVVCLGLGIVVGRNASRVPSTRAASGDGLAAQPLPGASADAPEQSGVAPAKALRFHGNSRAHNREHATAREELHTAIASRSEAADLTSAPPATAGVSNGQNAAADPLTQQGAPETSSAATASLNQIPGTPVPAKAPTATPDPTPRTPARALPPPDRLVPAHLIYRVEPFYPRDALQQRVEGTVKIHATIGQDGRVKNLRVVSGPPALSSAALDAAQYWRYIPALRNGETVESDEEISIEFHLQH